MKKRIPQEFINELLARTDIVELVGHRLALKKRGNNHFACCPFHNEKSASFSVHDKKQIYHCFGCKASGNAIGFLIEHDGMTFLEAIDTLASQHGMTVPTQAQDLPSDYVPMIELMEKAAHYYQQRLSKHSAAQEYLKKRGLSQDILDRYLIGYAPSGWENLAKKANQKNLLAKTGMLITKDDGSLYDRFRDRVMFPIRNNRGQFIAFGGRTISNAEPKYLNSPETPLFQKRSELYGLYEARQATRKLERVLIVEGYMDVIALAQYGISYCVATLGTASTTRHIHSLLRYTTELIFCFDGDRAGQQAAWRALETLLPIMRDNISVRFMSMPSGEDPDSLIRAIGKEQFEEKVSQASNFTDVFFQHVISDQDEDSLDGRAKSARAAMLLLQKMPTGILQSMMIDKLAETVKMNVEKLKSLIIENKPEPNRPQQPPRAPLPKLTSLVEKIIALLLQEPMLANTLDKVDQLQNLSISGVELLHQVIESCRQHSNLTTAALLSVWEQNPEKHLLMELTMREHLMPRELWQNELTDCWQKLFELDKEQKIQHLMELVNQQKLDKSDKIELMELLKS